MAPFGSQFFLRRPKDPSVTGKLRLTLQGHQGSVRCTSFSSVAWHQRLGKCERTTSQIPRRCFSIWRCPARHGGTPIAGWLITGNPLQDDLRILSLMEIPRGCFFLSKYGNSWGIHHDIYAIAISSDTD